MNHLRLASLTLLLALGLAGCTTPDTASLRVGMTRQEAVKVMGEPNSVSAQGGLEYLNYSLTESNAYGSTWTRPYYVRLQDGKVQAYGYMEQMNRLLAAGTGVNAAAKSAALKVGMSKDEAIAVMGPPSSVSAQGNYEYLNYTSSEPTASGFGTMVRPFYVRLVDGRVEAFGFTDQIGRSLPIVGSSISTPARSNGTITIESVSPATLTLGKPQTVAIRVKYTANEGDKFRVAVMGFATAPTHLEQLAEQVADGASGEVTVNATINPADWGNGAPIRLLAQLLPYSTSTGHARPLAMGHSFTVTVTP